MREHLKKNEAIKLTFPMVNSTTPAEFADGVTPAIAAYYNDGSGWTSYSITDSPSEISTTGVYEVDLTAAEMNHDRVMMKITASGAQDTFMAFKTYAKDIDDLNDVSAADVNAQCDTAIADAVPTNFSSLSIDGSGLVSLAADSVTSTSIQDGAITAAKIASSAITADKIASSAITAAKIAANAITEAKIEDNAIDEEHLSAACAAKIADILIRRSYNSVRTSSYGDAVDFRSLLGAIAMLVNKKDASDGSTLKVYHETDADPVFETSSVTSSSSADPMTVVDPS